jgi:putative addiction module component (TIGR02574 family)
MSPTDLAELLKLPAGERADIAIVLWESLSDEERNADLEPGPEERAELDRRWAEHLAEPDTAVPRHDVRRRLRDGT